MNSSDFSSSDAAELVLKERKRQRDLQSKHTRRQQQSPTASQQKPELETVSTPKWSQQQHAQLDEAELDRRHKALQQRLEMKQQDIQRQGKRLQKVREELKALEQPIRAEIMHIRQQLEQANREEMTLVDSVNSLRTELHTKEQHLGEVRRTKQDMADKLIKVMADYEKRKAERLNHIAELVADEEVPTKKPTPTSTFLGFS
ncbi:unnamed protein product [Agarophyton chilense]